MTTKNDFFSEVRSDDGGFHLFVGQGRSKENGVRFTVLKERIFSKGSRFDLVRVRIEPIGLARLQTIRPEDRFRDFLVSTVFRFSLVEATVFGLVFGLAASAFKVWIGS